MAALSRMARSRSRRPFAKRESPGRNAGRINASRSMSAGMFALLVAVLSITGTVDASHAPNSTGPNRPWTVSFSQDVTNPENAFTRQGDCASPTNCATIATAGYGHWVDFRFPSLSASWAVTGIEVQLGVQASAPYAVWRHDMQARLLLNGDGVGTGRSLQVASQSCCKNKTV